MRNGSTQPIFWLTLTVAVIYAVQLPNVFRIPEWIEINRNIPPSSVDYSLF